MSRSTSAKHASPAAARRRGRRIALILFAVCAAPVIAAWLAYFVWPPEKRTNYGELIEVTPLPEARLALLDGTPFRLAELKGRWIMLQIDGGACAASCQAKLYQMRQVRLTQGRERERIERVWLIDDGAQLETMTIRTYDGTHFVRAGGSTLLKLFPAGDKLHEHVYLIDPLGNLMLRFPRDADAARMKKDIERLLRVSRIG
jgi:hypothetical protein